MSATTTNTTPEVNNAAAAGAPPMSMNVTDAAVVEIKKFMAGEEGLPETAGLRVRVVPGGCSGFQYSLNIEEDSRQGDFVLDEKGVRMFVDIQIGRASCRERVSLTV